MSEQVCSPLKTMAECWQDDKRMNALFLPFRKKELNPVDWESKMKFWHGAIENWALEKNDCTISVKKLEKEFKRKERTPSCLGTVFEYLYRNGDIKPVDEFMNSVDNSQKSWTGWAVDSLVKAPVAWSFSKLKGAIMELDTSEIVYVYLHYLKVRGDEIMNMVKNRKKLLMSMEEVEHMIKESGGGVSGQQLKMVVDWLILQRRATVIVFESKTLIKFSEDGNKPAEAVTEADTALFTLKQNRTALIKNLEALESEKQQAIDEAKAYLKKGMRHAAKSSLRKKKELEKCIIKRSNALDNTETLLSRIRDAESDAQLVQAYKVGLSALKTTFKNAGLTEESVISTMDEVHEVIDIHDEIQSALSQSVGPGMDDELEKELSDLMELPLPPTKLPEPPEQEPQNESALLEDTLPDVATDELEELRKHMKELDLMLSD